jgi:hypothetical protein
MSPEEADALLKGEPQTKKKPVCTDCGGGQVIPLGPVRSGNSALIVRPDAKKILPGPKVVVDDEGLVTYMYITEDGREIPLEDMWG